MLTVSESADEIRCAVAAARRDGRLVGFVPTMGALHRGHRRLIEAARGECGFVVVSIFVNPTQFGPQEDFARYPRPRDADLEKCRQSGVDAVFYPDVETVYPPGFCTYVEVEGLSTAWEGASRENHFRGVATVVTKLFNIVQPDRAYFGQKDYQQQTLIRRMVRDLNLPLEVRICPTERESDGLALSSRNAFLDPGQRRAAIALWESLELARQQIRSGENDLAAVREAMLRHLQQAPGVQPDYATIADPDSLLELEQPQPEMVALVAAQVGGVRLIDNLLIQV